MSISDEAKAVIQTEETILADVFTTLREQRSRDLSRLSIETARSRALTSELVGAHRLEDKAMLASDEAVAHGLTTQKLKDVSAINTLLKKPYFARIVLNEEDVKGNQRDIEYKLGFAANTECRIVDWRKGPIAKLYYEYKEGDEYSEEIQGRERVGRVELRNTVDITKEEIIRLNCRLGVLEKRNGEWFQSGGDNRQGRASGELPEILSLITSEQYRMITEEATTAVLIQGIAGSGKTTVALHRLAWLLHESNSPLKTTEAIIVVLTNALKTYVSKTLPRMDIHGVRVVTFHELASETIKGFLPQFVTPEGALRRPERLTPHGIGRVKRSMATLLTLEARAGALKGDLSNALVNLFSNSAAILEQDESKLLNRQLIEEARAHTIKNMEQGALDFADDALLLRLIELAHGGLLQPRGMAGRYGHIVLDEVQDYSPTELACLVDGVKDPKNLTIVGDSSQKTSIGPFPGWERLRERWGLKDSVSKYMTLTVSHRSTLPIMKLADYVLQRNLVTEGRPGRSPIWFRCRGASTDSESIGIQTARDWLLKAMEKYPGYVTAVICTDTHEAKYVASLLTPTFGGAVRLGDEYSFSFEEGIVVTDIRAVKGLEFMNVLIWNPSTKSYPSEKRNALYIAISRAEENVCIVTWSKPSELLPSFNSPLIRAVDITEEAEEEERDDRSQNE